MEGLLRSLNVCGDKDDVLEDQLVWSEKHVVHTLDTGFNYTLVGVTDYSMCSVLGFFNCAACHLLSTMQV